MLILVFLGYERKSHLSFLIQLKKKKLLMFIDLLKDRRLVLLKTPPTHCYRAVYM